MTLAYIRFEECNFMYGFVVFREFLAEELAVRRKAQAIRTMVPGQL